jgi:ABC-type multidrug transport system fused ATPase/permease subunit
MEVTSMVLGWLNEEIENNGLILMHSDESSSVEYGTLKFFSKETNTIYSPYLDVAWDDSVLSWESPGFDTGSASPIQIRDAVCCSKTGSGKSTLLDIAIGILKPYSGNVLINKTHIRDLEEKYKFITYLPQLPFLIDGSLYDNIFFGTDLKKDNLKVEDIKYLDFVLEKTCCKKFIDELPNKLDTIVGENGLGLSVGQKQKINLARGLISRSKILIMDEPTSALDPATEEIIIYNIFNSFKDLSLIIVTHRHEMLKNFEKVFELKKSKLLLKNI